MEIPLSPSFSLSLRLRSLFQPWSRQFFSTPIPRIDQTLVNLHPSRCVRGRWFEGHINSRAGCFSFHTHAHTRTWILLLADRYHVSYAFCHGEIHSTIFHLSPPLPLDLEKSWCGTAPVDGTSNEQGRREQEKETRGTLDPSWEGDDGKWREEW